MTTSTTTPLVQRLSIDFLQRAAANTRFTHQAAAIAELERRDLVEQRRAYFSPAAPTTAVDARDLSVGNVITYGRGWVRMVIRDVYRLPQSDRVLVAFSYTNLSDGEVDEVVHELPVMAGDREVRLVRESVPDFTALAVAR
jgi:hypothetical protein